MEKRRNKKIVRYRKTPSINIGVVIFGIIFVYLLYYAYIYFTTTHISAYEVNQGSIAQDTTFQGLILRDETVYYAQDNGYINYYYKDGSKASVGNYVYSVDTAGTFHNQISAMEDGQLVMTEEAYNQIDQVVEEYIAGYSDNDFQQVYQFRYDMDATLMEILNSNARNEIGSAMAEAAVHGLHAYTAETPGVVVYYTDGMEGVTVDNFTGNMFDTNAYEKNNFLKRELVSAGEPVYKMINSELWHVVVPLDEALAEDLKEVENIRVEFKKDNSKVWGTSAIVKKGGTPYLVLGFKNSMIRFAGDRYTELELLLTDTTGLKIPNSSIVTKEFFVIPKEYVSKGGDSNNNGVLLTSVDEAGVSTTGFKEVTVFLETEDGDCYIAAEGITLGSVIVKTDSQQQFTLKEKAKLEGVYNINKGYAVFRRIEKLFENEEYTIIDTGTSNGIALYDHIALDGSTINENDILR